LIQTRLWVELKEKVLNPFNNRRRKLRVEASIQVARGHLLRHVETRQTPEHPSVVYEGSIDLAVGSFCKDSLSVVGMERTYIDQPRQPEHFAATQPGNRPRRQKVLAPTVVTDD
jgi:hypothetical protein